MKRGLLVILGWICVVLGTAGIFLPLLPTTIFILIASWCFARSSKRFHQWLHTHPRLGPILESWQSGQGLPIKTKLKAIVVLWCSMGISIYLVFDKVWLVGILIVIGICISAYLYRLPNADLKKL